jgi:thiol-disulfide isomerase/thioredoxin
MRALFLLLLLLISGTWVCECFYEEEGAGVEEYEDQSEFDTDGFFDEDVFSGEGTKVGALEDGEEESEEDELVIKLDETSFWNLMQPVDVLDGEPAASQFFVKVYAPWCGHCRALSPTWDDLAHQMEGRLPLIAKLDATEPGLEAALEYLGIEGFPTLVLIDNLARKMYHYDGERDLESLVAFASGGYKNYPSERFHEDKTTIDLVKDVASSIVSSRVLPVHQFDPFLLPAFTFIGFIFGSILTCLCLPRRVVKEKAD